jgi:hypothetical protein
MPKTYVIYRDTDAQREREIKRITHDIEKAEAIRRENARCQQGS